MVDENGVLAKLAQYRREFLDGFEAAAKEFSGRIRALREEYLSRVVDATLTDPRLSEVEKALSFRSAQPVASAQSTSSQQVTPASATMIALPEKWPMKGEKQFCQACGSPLDVNAKFCGQCAHPTFPF